MKETFKDIKGYEGFYQVSNLGRVKRLEHRRYDKRHILKEKIIKNINCKSGYCVVGLWKNGKQKQYRVHRLVAEAFIPNPNNHPIINHIDSNTKNNCVDNLEWCTQSHNIKEAFRLNRKKSPNKNKFGKENPRAKRICQYDLGGKFIKEWGSIIDAARELNLNATCILQCCKGKYKRVGNYTFKYQLGSEDYGR